MIFTSKNGSQTYSHPKKKGRNYSIFKRNLNLEPYISTLSRGVFIPTVKFRTCIYKLPIETGWWHEVPENERKYILCNQNDLADDFRHLLKCSFFKTERRELLRPRYYNRPNIIKFQDLLNYNNKHTDETI